MQEHILISPLGFSPGAVSGAAFGLQRRLKKEDEENKLCRVLTLGTSHPRVHESAGYLATLFGQAEITYEREHIPQPELRQYDKSSATYVARMGSILETAVKTSAVVHVAITGGRSGMGALAALAASLYGANHLWHLWVSEEIELKGRIGNLPQPVDKNNIYLNPPENQYELVELPFLNMRPLHKILWNYYHREELNAEEPLVEKLLQANFINADGMKMADIFPAGATLNHKWQVEKMVKSAGEPTNTQHKLIVEILEQAGLLNEGNKSRLLQILELGFHSSDVMEFAENEEVEGSFWHYLNRRRNEIQQVVASRKRPISRSQLLENFIQSFKLDEIKSLCYELGIDYEELGAERKSPIITELITFAEQRGRLPELVVYADKQRPHLTWFEDGKGGIEKKTVTEADLFLMHGLQMWLNFRNYKH